MANKKRDPVNDRLYKCWLSSLGKEKLHKDDTVYEVYLHRKDVGKLIDKYMSSLTKRKHHDDSKISDEELPTFLEYIPKLKDTQYGSDDYNRNLECMKEGLEHHYANNRHHPEHFEDGIKGMNLVDIVEMLCDWIAATNRKGGDIFESIEYSQTRFGFSDELKQILINTVKDLDI